MTIAERRQFRELAALVAQLTERVAELERQIGVEPPKPPAQVAA